MRTTLTLEDDVAATLRRIMKSRGGSFKDTINEALRHGLKTLDASPAARERFRVTPLDLGGSLVGSLDNVEEVLSRVEGENHS